MTAETSQSEPAFKDRRSKDQPIRTGLQRQEKTYSISQSEQGRKDRRREIRANQIYPSCLILQGKIWSKSLKNINIEKTENLHCDLKVCIKRAGSLKFSTFICRDGIFDCVMTNLLDSIHKTSNANVGVKMRLRECTSSSDWISQL